MNCCDFSRVITHNDNSSKLTNTLKFYTFLYLGFSILKLFVMKGGDFFSEILIFFLLLLTINQCYFYTAIFALFFVLFQLFIESFTLLLIIQDYVFNLAQINMLIAIIELFIRFLQQSFPKMCTLRLFIWGGEFYDANSGIISNFYSTV